MRWKALRHSAQYALLQSLLGPLSVLPARLGARAASLLLSGAGTLKLNRLALANLDVAFGETISRSEKKKVLRRLYGHLGRIASELAAFRREGPALVRRLVQSDPSTGRLAEASTRGSGAVVVTPHFSNWEFIAAWFVLQGHRVAVVGKRMKNPRIEKVVAEVRRTAGVELIHQDDSPRKILRFLKEKGYVGILPDADTTRLEGIFLDFFGRPTYTPVGPASLSILSGAPIFPVFLVFEGGRYRLVVDEPAFPDSRERTEQGIRRLSEHWTRSFEAMIRRHPDQWIWFHRRWTTTPENVEIKRSRRRLAEEAKKKRAMND